MGRKTGHGGDDHFQTDQGLRARLEATDPQWRFTDDEMRTVVGHLENYGYVKWLRTSRGERHVLLAPELLNNLAAYQRFIEIEELDEGVRGWQVRAAGHPRAAAGRE